MEDYSKYELIKGGESREQSNVNSLREQFVIKYCAQNGWDSNNLTNEQMNQIRMCREYNNPDILFG